jgi:hypothetical protein
MIGCDCGGGYNKGKAGAGGAHVPLQMTDVDVSKRCGFREACKKLHDCSVIM